jgi:hypothetical protein
MIWAYLSISNDVDLLCALCLKVVHYEGIGGVEFGDGGDLRLAHQNLRLLVYRFEGINYCGPRSIPRLT